MEEISEEVVLRLPDDIHKLCRTCLTVSNDKMQPCHDILIFNEYNILTEVAEMLQSCSSIKIKPEEGLPMSICDDCANKLEIAYNFKHQCEKTDASLRKIMEMPAPENTENQKLENITIKQEIVSIKQEIIEEPKNQPILYDHNLQNNNIDIDTTEEVDISQLFEQRKMLIDKYLFIEDIELQIGKAHKINKQDDIYSLIKERKTYTENGTNELKSIKQEEDSDVESFMEYICPLCHKLFTNEQKCQTHVTECSKRVKQEENDDSGENFPPFECHVCGKTFKTKYKQKLHVASHVLIQPNANPSETFVCDLCNKTFRTETKLAAHFYNHAKIAAKEIKNPKGEDTTNSQIISCYLCAEIFMETSDLDNHIKFQHKKDGKVTCEICSSEFDGEASLINHLKKHGIQITFCKICLKRFDSIHKLRFHQKIHVAEKARTIFKCPICKQDYNTPELLRKHSLEHINEAYKCVKCKRTFNNIISYESHVKQHSEPKFLCSVCGKQYFNSVTLACHVRSHNNEKPFVCGHCNKAFSSRATLSVHKRIHSSFKPYVCSYCGYSCRQSGDLAMHVRTHTGDKPYKCTFPNCDRRFTTSSQRKEHYRRHTNERNHKCKECGKAFLESKTLKVHMLTHTGEKPHCCEICGKKFRRSHHLSNHVKGHINYTIPTGEDIELFGMKYDVQ